MRFKINICLFLDYFPGARLDTADMTGVSEYPLLTEKYCSLFVTL